tara:strand:+ start:375 stop:1082 length:708 start_codon:yes stop_codon:yes gene_type:complete
MSLLFRNNIKLLVCDMAGTIINEKGIIYKAIGSTLNKLGYPMSVDESKTWHGRDKREVLYKHITSYYGFPNKKHIMDRVNKAEKLLLTELEQKYFEDNNIELIDKELLDFFGKLRADGIKVVLNTGYPKDFQERIIKHFDLTHSVDTWISSEEVLCGRPAPYMIHQLMEQCEIPSVNNVAKVGDTVNDMKEGINAGCKLNIGVLSGADSITDLSKYTDVILDKITDLDNRDIHVY